MPTPRTPHTRKPDAQMNGAAIILKALQDQGVYQAPGGS